jgi:hypothetical protein
VTNPVAHSLETHRVKVSNDTIAKLVQELENCTVTADRDALIVSLIVYMLCLSDPDITNTPERLQLAVKNVSDYVVWILTTTDAPDPQTLN